MPGLLGHIFNIDSYGQMNKSFFFFFKKCKLDYIKTARMLIAWSLTNLCRLEIQDDHWPTKINNKEIVFTEIEHMLEQK